MIVEAGAPPGTEERGYLGKPIKGRQLLAVGSFIFILILKMLVRSFFLQVIQGNHYLALAEGNRVREVIIPAPRGLIYDQYGETLTENYPEFSLAIVPNDIPADDNKRRNIFNEVSKVSDLPAEKFEAIWQSLPEERRRRLDPVLVPQPLSYAEGLRLNLYAPSWSGVTIVTIPKRRATALNDLPSSWSHLLGYVGPVTEEDLIQSENFYSSQDAIGKNGLELSYEKILRGKNGHRDIEINALGEEQPRFSEVKPEAGRNIWLTVDGELQSFAESVLQKGLVNAGAAKGALVILDPATGGVLAMVSLPTFNVNEFNEGMTSDNYKKLSDDPGHPLFNRAIQGTYPSGSTIKPVIAAAALQEKVITPTTSILSTGGLWVYEWFFPDWKAGGHGQTSVKRAIAESVNTFFYTIGGGYNDFVGLGIDRLERYARLFGLGAITGIDLPGEAKGLFPSAEWKEKNKNELWYIGDTYHASIGQGDVLVTPLQVAAYTAAIANGGTLWQPHLVGEIVSSDGKPKQQIAPQANARDLVSPEWLQVVREGMRQTVTIGSARSLQSLPIPVAGKTGTAEVGGNLKPHGWFTGFAPYQDPEIVVTVLIENCGEGGTYAVPVAKQIFQWWYDNRVEK